MTVGQRYVWRIRTAFGLHVVRMTKMARWQDTTRQEEHHFHVLNSGPSVLRHTGALVLIAVVYNARWGKCVSCDRSRGRACRLQSLGRALGADMC